MAVMERCLLVKLLHTHTKKEMNRRPLATLGHEYEGRWMARVRGSASNKSGDTHPWRRRFCSESTRSCCKCVESVERGDPPCQRKHSAFQPPLHPTANKVMRQHASCDARCNKLLHALCDYRMRPRHCIPPARHSASAHQRSHAACLISPRSDHHQRRPSSALRNANGLQQNELSRPSLPRLPVARPTASTG